MARQTSPRTTSATAPLRSASAAQAHAANTVTWTIDLAQSPARITERAMHASNRRGMALGLVAGGIWLYDIVSIAAR